MMKVIPFGFVLQDRFELSKKYNLIEQCSGFWRLTEKARKYYEPISFIEFLKGQSNAPKKIENNNNNKNILIKEIISL